MPQVVVRLGKEDVARWGFDPLDVLDVIRTAYEARRLDKSTKEIEFTTWLSFWPPAAGPG
jgi:hypothetical protein